MGKSPSSRSERTERDKWVLAFRMITELCKSPAAFQAGKIVFGIEPEPAKPIARKDAPVNTPERLLAKTSRLLMLSSFHADHPGVRDVTIYRTVRVHKADWYRWKRGELPDTSDMTVRIEHYLRAPAKKDERFPTLLPCAPTYPSLDPANRPSTATLSNRRPEGNS